MTANEDFTMNWAYRPSADKPLVGQASNYMWSPTNTNYLFCHYYQASTSDLALHIEE